MAKQVQALFVACSWKGGFCLVFSSMVFLCVFLPVVFLLSRLSKSIPYQNGLLIVASLLFYAYGEPYYVFLMLFSVLVNWFLGLAMKNGPQKWAVWLAIVINIGLLFVFKYLDLALSGVNALFGLTISLPHLPLPVGISFFTFQALSYVIDVYRQEVPAQKSLWHVMLYISLFPQLIAGPIVKYHDVAEEIEHRSMDSQTTALGFRRFCVGLGKKVLISNTLASTVDLLFAANPSYVNIGSAWVAALCYLFQIYFDFSGYSDMAIGLGEVFGFHFHQNFNYPYISCSIQEFWRRWHISLSTWFREYLYIPLGGNRKGTVRTYVNKLIVFLATGIWHGANLTFVLWGLWHGCFIVLEDLLHLNRLPKFIGWLGTMLIVIVGFVMFRADTVSQGFFMITQMFTGFHFDWNSMALLYSVCSPVLALALVAAALGSAPLWQQVNFDEAPMVSWSYLGGYALLVVCLLALSAGTYNPFIYFRF